MTETIAHATSPAVPSESDFSKAMTWMKSETQRMKDLIKQEEMLLLPVQAAAMMGISQQSLERRMKDGNIRSFTVLGKVWVSGKQVDEIMNERIQKLKKAGVEKNKIEEGIYRKMFLNAKQLRKKQKELKRKR